jgi:hypothetical protein
VTLWLQDCDESVSSIMENSSNKFSTDEHLTSLMVTGKGKCRSDIRTFDWRKNCSVKLREEKAPFVIRERDEHQLAVQPLRTTKTLMVWRPRERRGSSGDRS